MSSLFQIYFEIYYKYYSNIAIQILSNMFATHLIVQYMAYRYQFEYKKKLAAISHWNERIRHMEISSSPRGNLIWELSQVAQMSLSPTAKCPLPLKLLHLYIFSLSSSTGQSVLWKCESSRSLGTVWTSNSNLQSSAYASASMMHLCMMHLFWIVHRRTDAHECESALS